MSCGIDIESLVLDLFCGIGSADDEDWSVFEADEYFLNTVGIQGISSVFNDL